MPEYLKYVDNSTQDVEFSRGYYVESGTLDLAFEKVPTQTKFGRSHKDIVEFSAYNSVGDTLLGWGTISGAENYSTNSLYYTNYAGELESGNLRILESVYPTTNGKVILSPITELKKLGLSAGVYQVGFSFKNDIVGSHDSDSKLVVSEISPSRTEVKIIPECVICLINTAAYPWKTLLNRWLEYM